MICQNKGITPRFILNNRCYRNYKKYIGKYRNVNKYRNYGNYGPLRGESMSIQYIGAAFLERALRFGRPIVTFRFIEILLELTPACRNSVITNFFHARLELATTRFDWANTSCEHFVHIQRHCVRYIQLSDNALDGYRMDWTPLPCRVLRSSAGNGRNPLWSFSLRSIQNMICEQTRVLSKWGHVKCFGKSQHENVSTWRLACLVVQTLNNKTSKTIRGHRVQKKCSLNKSFVKWVSLRLSFVIRNKFQEV